MNEKIAAIIVTYNRSEDLKRAIRALECQTQTLDLIFVIDNASTDATKDVLDSFTLTLCNRLITISLSENTGGSGGYYTGLKEALKHNIDRFWLLDDDAEVANDALEQLTEYAKNNNETYCTTAISSSDRTSLCWPPSRNHQTHNQLNEITESNFAPFLGYYIHRETVEKIGLPRKEYFISGDDYEYSLRIKNTGKKIYWIKNSKLYHPAPPKLQREIYGKTFKHLILPSWRRFYDVRNRIWTARIHNSAPWLFLVVFGILVHLLISLITENNKKDQLTSYYKGIQAGLTKTIRKISH